MNKAIGAETDSPAAASAPSRLTGGEAVVAGLKRWGINTLFGLPGVQLDGLFDALYRARGDIRVIHTRHEQGAAYMALGHAMATGDPSAFAVVPGPGVLNAGAALATAYACNAPVFCITSTVRLPFLDRNYGALHEINDQLGILRRLTKWCARATHPGEIPELMDEAFRQLLSGRPRPVALEIPMEVLLESGLVAFGAQPVPSMPFLDTDAVDAAAELARGSRNPLIVVGSGALSASEPVRRLAEIMQAPVISRQLGRGVIDDRNDFSVPGAIGNELWKSADLVIGVGTRLQHLREWGVDSRLKVIRIDVDPMEIGRVAPPAVTILADAGPAVTALHSQLSQSDYRPEPRAKQLRLLKDQLRTECERALAPQLAYVDVIRRALPQDGIFVDEMTQVAYVAKFAFPVYHPRTFVSSGYQGTLGYGFATALGAQVAAGTRRVVSICGDGGFMYNVQELATAVLHKIPLVTIVFSDGHFGNVRRIQLESYEGRVHASNLCNPDFCELAQNFGAIGMRARGPAELEGVLAQAFQKDGPVLIEVPVDTDSTPSPWKYIHGRVVRP